MMERKFSKMPEGQSVLDGVCSGMAYWLGLPTGLIRCLFLMGFFLSGFTLLAYVILIFTMDEWDEVPEDYNERTS